MTVSPQVVTYGQKSTVTVHTPLPPCPTPNVPSTPSGCFNRDNGYTGINLRLVPPTNPDFINSANHPNLRRAGNCYAPTKCTFWFVRPPAGTGTDLTGHWLVAQVRATINVGIVQPDPGCTASSCPGAGQFGLAGGQPHGQGVRDLQERRRD